MIKKITRQLTASLIISLVINNTSLAQNSILVNFGSTSCTGSGEPAFSFINNPLGDSPSVLDTCSLISQLPSIFGVFIAYNPKNNKIYVADIHTFTETKIWVLDMGLPANITCPSTISETPDYSYSYVSNNFEFDNNGDLWSFSNYNDTIGQCNIDKFDVNTGAVINSRVVQFPADNFPTSITSGDLTILPNGRMFATLGSFPSRLYEIKNYKTNSAATATYLVTLPQSCFGIAYLNGDLEITGSDFSGNCYYYKYNISSGILDSAKNFQNAQLPIDNTSITPSLGVTKLLLNSVKVNSNTGDFTYEIYVRNLGNVALNNINVNDNLAKVFGANNISNVTVAFVPDENAGNLILNPLYNGTTDTTLLLPNQNLANQTSINTDYFFKLRVSLRVTNLGVSTYLNSAIGSATIGSVGTQSFINISDSSNNGPASAVDPNNNGNAGEPGENVPTPFNLSTLPVKFVSINASIVNKTSAQIKWVIATPGVTSDKFEIEYSADGRRWNSIGIMDIRDANQRSYQFIENNIPAGNLYYRVREIDIDGAYVYSDIVLLHNKSISESLAIFPNPANNFVSISTPYNGIGKTQLTLYDAIGKKLTSITMAGTTEEISTAQLPDGAYLLKVAASGSVATHKILVMHK